MKSKSNRTNQARLGLVLIVFFGFSECYAQGKVVVNGVNVNDLPIEYVQILGSDIGLFKKNVVVTVDYGQKMKFAEPQTITGDDGKHKSFESVIGALNFMSENGWEFVTAYAVTVGSGTANQSNVYHYLLRKKK